MTSLMSTETSWYAQACRAADACRAVVVGAEADIAALLVAGRLFGSAASGL
jgi:hypothetical protein